MTIRPTLGLLISRERSACAILLAEGTLAIALLGVFGAFGLYLVTNMWLPSAVFVCFLFFMSWIGDWHYSVSVHITPTRIRIKERGLFVTLTHEKTIDGKFMCEQTLDDFLLLRPAHQIVFRSTVPHLADFGFYCFRPKQICEWLNNERIRLSGHTIIPRAFVPRIVK